MDPQHPRLGLCLCAAVRPGCQGQSRWGLFGVVTAHAVALQQVPRDAQLAGGIAISDGTPVRRPVERGDAATWGPVTVHQDCHPHRVPHETGWRGAWVPRKTALVSQGVLPPVEHGALVIDACRIHAVALRGVCDAGSRRAIRKLDGAARGAAGRGRLDTLCGNSAAVRLARTIFQVAHHGGVGSVGPPTPLLPGAAPRAPTNDEADVSSARNGDRNPPSICCSVNPCSGGTTAAVG
mmetsp:Transcript_5329/g.16137  ORF Transcript_5329/g.16137 Transcript_5329/m.16137 type:complete len:237 (+) Transcript_5329:854-1564(+)